MFMTVVREELSEKKDDVDLEPWGGGHHSKNWGAGITCQVEAK